MSAAPSAKVSARARISAHACGHSPYPAKDRPKSSLFTNPFLSALHKLMLKGGVVE